MASMNTSCFSSNIIFSFIVTLTSLTLHVLAVYVQDYIQGAIFHIFERIEFEFLWHDHFTECSPVDHWNQPATNATFLSNISLLDDADQYPSCNNEVFGMLYW